MRLVDFTDGGATGGNPKVWVNPEHVRIVSVLRDGSMIVLDESVIFVRESIQTVIHRLQYKGDA